MAGKVSDEASVAAWTTERQLIITTASSITKLDSPAWGVFKFNPAGDGGTAASATCGWCNKTLCAGRNNGTSHLLRHINKSCPARAEERRRQPTTTPAAAAETSPDGEQQELEELYIVDGLNIPQLYDELDAKGLVLIDQASDAHFKPNLPQKANSSSMWFFQKKRERRASSCSTVHGGTGTISGDSSCGNNKFTENE